MDDITDSDNAVFLRGRLAAAPQVRALPSGDELCTFRLTVRRPPGSRTAVDSIDCVSARPVVRKVIERTDPGDILELHGRLERRFWRGSSGPVSRYAVQVARAKRVRS